MKQQVEQREWKDAPRWAGASRIPMWFFLFFYGGGTLALTIKTIIVDGWKGFDQTYWCLTTFGIFACFLASYCLISIHRAKRYVQGKDKK